MVLGFGTGGRGGKEKKQGSFLGGTRVQRAEQSKMLTILRDRGKDSRSRNLVEVRCTWCFGVKTMRVEHAVKNDSCGCRKQGTAFVLAERRKNLWDKYVDTKQGPAIVCREIRNSHATV